MKFRSGSLPLAILGILLTAMTATAGTPPIGSTTKPLQFTSGGHIVGFTSKDVVVATGSHALRVEFVGAQGVEPVAAGAATTDGKAAPLTRVSYPGLWEGIDLAYDAPSGLLRSTYTLAPGADPKQIRLRYNAPVAVEPGGELKIAFATGAMHESAPVAWQQIDGHRVAVMVAFATTAESGIGFKVGPYDKAHALTIDPTLTWNTFLGGTSADIGNGIAVDTNGNVYVTGESSATWGTPIRAYGGGSRNAFVAKLNTNGALLWNTFLCGPGYGYGNGIAVDANGNVYITGLSYTWGTPIRACQGGFDTFVAKLNTNGALLWNTFLGGTDWDQGLGIAVDTNGNAYVTGDSFDTWGTPIRAFQGGSGCNDAFVAKLNTNGALLWNTFLGGTDEDVGTGIAVDTIGNVYVTGWSFDSWGTPIRASEGAIDAFAAKLNTNGGLLWNTFLGGVTYNDYHGIAVDANGNAYVTGHSVATWGTPIRAYQGMTDAFVAKLNTNGALLWNTFLGGTDADYGYGIAVDTNGNAYVTGESYATWGTPIRAYQWGVDAFVAKLNTNGALLWNTFLGGTGTDDGHGMAADTNGTAYVTGDSAATWGTPLRTFAGGTRDAFVSVISDKNWRSGEVDKGGGWKQLSWFGMYNTAFLPWIYHAQHGFLYPYDNGGGAVFFWYHDMQQFVWTTPTTYPFLYRYDATPSWLWYVKGSAGPRKFYDYGAGAWESLP